MGGGTGLVRCRSWQDVRVEPQWNVEKLIKQMKYKNNAEKENSYTYPPPQIVDRVERLQQNSGLLEVKLNPLPHLVSQDVLRKRKPTSFFVIVRFLSKHK